MSILEKFLLPAPSLWGYNKQRTLSLWLSLTYIAFPDQRSTCDMIPLQCCALLSYTDALLLTQLPSSLPLHIVSINLQHANTDLSTQCYALTKQQGFEDNGNVTLVLSVSQKESLTRRNLTDRRINYFFIPKLFSVYFSKPLLHFLCSSPVAGSNFSQ